MREASIAALKEAISAGTGHGDIRVSSQHFDMAFTKVKPSVSAKVSKKKIILILSLPVTTLVVYSSRLLLFLGGPRSDCYQSI